MHVYNVHCVKVLSENSISLFMAVQFIVAFVLLHPHIAHTHTHTHTHTLTHSLTHSLTDSLTYTHSHTHNTDKYPEFVFSRVANLEQYLSVAGSSLLHQPRSLPSLMEAWHSLIPSHIKQRKVHTELPLLVRSEMHETTGKS